MGGEREGGGGGVKKSKVQEGLITAENISTLSYNRCLADRFASCDNIVSRSQAYFLHPLP